MKQGDEIYRVVYISERKRWFCGFGKDGRVQTAFCVAGAYPFTGGCNPRSASKLTYIQSQLKLKGLTGLLQTVEVTDAQNLDEAVELVYSKQLVREPLNKVKKWLHKGK